MAIKVISVTAIPMIFRLIDSRIIAVALLKLRGRKLIRDIAAAISAIGHRSTAADWRSGSCNLMRVPLMRLKCW